MPKLNLTIKSPDLVQFMNNYETHVIDETWREKTQICLFLQTIKAINMCRSDFNPQTPLILPLFPITPFPSPVSCTTS